MLSGSAARAAAAAVHADVAAVAAALPAGAVADGQSYLAIRAQETSGIAPLVPFLVAFGMIGMVMSVLIVANVVSGAVVAGYRRIGILKSIGFTPGQVVAAYAGQVAVPGRWPGCLGGVRAREPAGRCRCSAGPRASTGSATCACRPGSDVAVRGGDVAASSASRPCCPRCGPGGSARPRRSPPAAPGSGPRLRRAPAAGRLPLPRPVTIGLAGPFARPAAPRSRWPAIVLGATAVTFAVGLSASLNRVVDGLSRRRPSRCRYVPATAKAAPMSRARGTQQGRAGGRPAACGDPGAGGRRRAAGHRGGAARSAGDVALRRRGGAAGRRGRVAQQIPVTAFRGDAAWTGYAMISGHWYSGPGQVDVPTDFLTVTGKAVGDTVTITAGHTQIPVRIVGEVFDTSNRGLEMFTGWRTLARAAATLMPDQYDVGLRPGTSAAGVRAGPAARARARTTR